MNAVDFAKQANEIFVLSDSFIRIKELIDDETSTIDDIADVILLDPALAATVLKLANSSFFNYPGKIDTISKAVLVLGITEVYNLVIAYFTAEAFKSVTAPSSYLDDFWERSVDCALLVKFLGNELKIPKAERLFILGLLHNLGELIIKELASEKIDACDDASVKQLPWLAQQEVLGFTYGECSAELLKQWQLPFTIVGPISQQDLQEVAQADPESQLLYIAKRVMLSHYHVPKKPVEAFLSQEELELFNLEYKTVQAAITYCDMERLGVLSTIKPGAMMIF